MKKIPRYTRRGKWSLSSAVVGLVAGTILGAAVGSAAAAWWWCH